MASHQRAVGPPTAQVASNHQAYTAPELKYRIFYGPVNAGLQYLIGRYQYLDFLGVFVRHNALKLSLGEIDVHIFESSYQKVIDHARQFGKKLGPADLLVQYYGSMYDESLVKACVADHEEHMYQRVSDTRYGPKVKLLYQELKKEYPQLNIQSTLEPFDRELVGKPIQTPEEFFAEWFEKQSQKQGQSDKSQIGENENQVEETATVTTGVSTSSPSVCTTISSIEDGFPDAYYNDKTKDLPALMSQVEERFPGTVLKRHHEVKTQELERALKRSLKSNDLQLAWAIVCGVLQAPFGPNKGRKQVIYPVAKSLPRMFPPENAPARSDEDDCDAQAVYEAICIAQSRNIEQCRHRNTIGKAPLARKRSYPAAPVQGNEMLYEMKKVGRRAKKVAVRKHR